MAASLCLQDILLFAFLKRNVGILEELRESLSPWKYPVFEYIFNSHNKLWLAPDTASFETKKNWLELLKPSPPLYSILKCSP